MSIADRPGLAVGFVGGSIAANGTSGFLGALVAGFVAGYIVLLLKKVFSKLPESLDGMKPVLLYPLLGIFLVGVIMQFVVEPPIGALNTAINNGLNGLNGASAVVLGILLGGMMSVDMGGPVNKAAYVFGTASIAAGNYNISSYDWRYGSTNRNRSCNNLLQEQVHSRGEKGRTYKLYHGIIIYHRGCNPIRSI